MGDCLGDWLLITLSHEAAQWHRRGHGGGRQDYRFPFMAFHWVAVLVRGGHAGNDCSGHVVLMSLSFLPASVKLLFLFRLEGRQAGRHRVGIFEDLELPRLSVDPGTLLDHATDLFGLVSWDCDEDHVPHLLLDRMKGLDRGDRDGATKVLFECSSNDLSATGTHGVHQALQVLPESKVGDGQELLTCETLPHSDVAWILHA